MNLDRTAREGRLSRRQFLKIAAVGSGSLVIPSCTKYITTGPEDDGDGGIGDDGDGGSIKYSSVSGGWKISEKDDFGNSEFKGYLSIENLNLTQTNQLKSGYSDVYRLTGDFGGFTLGLQRKSSGTTYLVFQNASGNIFDGGINTSPGSHNLEFYLGNSGDYRLRGVAPGYESMWGDLRVKVDMGNIFRTSDGVVTLTGGWDSKRK